MKLHILFYSIGMIFGGIIIGFIRGFLFTLVIIGLAPLIMIFMYLFLKNELKASKIF